MEVNKADSTAKFIKHHRTRLNYTQQYLSDVSGISLRSLQRIENGQVVPRASTLHLLAKHLEVELPELTYKDLPTKSESGKNFKLVLSILLAGILISLALAFIFQSATFPESAFELALFIAGGLAVYWVLLVLIWRGVK